MLLVGSDSFNHFQSIDAPSDNRIGTRSQGLLEELEKKKLKPDKFIMGKPSQNYGVPPKYGAHNFTCSPT